MQPRFVRIWQCEVCGGYSSCEADWNGDEIENVEDLVHTVVQFLDPQILNDSEICDVYEDRD